MRIVNVNKRIAVLENAIERSSALYGKMLLNSQVTDNKLNEVENLMDSLRTKRDALNLDIRAWLYDRSVSKKDRMSRYNQLNLVKRNLK